MAKKDDNPSCLGMIAGIAIFFLLYKLVEYILSIKVVQSVLTYFAAGLIGIVLLFNIIYLPGMLFGHLRSRKSHDYPVRCWLVEDSGSPDIQAGKGLPVYLLLTVNDFCLELAALQTSRAWSMITADNLSRFSKLSRGHPTPIRIPRRGTSLDYRVFRDEVPGELEGAHIRIVLTYTAFGGPKLSEATEIGDSPVQAMLAVVKNDGQEDLTANRELYQRLRSFIKNPELYDEEDDDSWMYRSRPMY